MTASFGKVAQGLYLEGLAADTATGEVWYSDVIAGGIHRVSPDGGIASYNKERMWTGGILLNEDGCVLSSGAEGIQWTEPATGRTGWLVEGIGVNEMVPDGSGGIYFGSIDLASIIRGEPAGPARMHRLSLDGTVTVASEELGFINGIALSADGRRLFYNESFNATCAFDVASDGSLSKRRVVLEKYDCDGMALDAEGNLWITGFTSSEIVRMRPDGTLLEPFATPAEAVTQLRFGGADGRDFWIAAVPRDAGADLAVGKLPSEERSFIWRGRSDIVGAPQSRSRFRLK